MSEQTEELSFERAEYAHAQGSAPCADCQQPLAEQYWSWQDKLLCEGCRGQLERSFGTAKSAGSFGKAALWGGLTALGCGIAYAVFVALTDIQLALATIGIGILVANVVRKASHGMGGRRYQLLAVALTYGAAAMGYGPAVWHDVMTPESAEVTEGVPEEAPAAVTPPASGEPVPAGELALGLLIIVAVTLAAPILTIVEAPIGFAIVLFGLWEAWKLSTGVPTEILGPFRVASATPQTTTT